MLAAIGIGSVVHSLIGPKDVFLYAHARASTHGRPGRLHMQYNRRRIGIELTRVHNSFLQARLRSCL